MFRSVGHVTMVFVPYFTQVPLLLSKAASSVAKSRSGKAILAQPSLQDGDLGRKFSWSTPMSGNEGASSSSAYDIHRRSDLVDGRNTWIFPHRNGFLYATTPHSNIHHKNPSA